MSNQFDDAVQQYLANRRNAIQQTLEADETAKQAQAGLISGQTARDVGMAGSKFSDKLAEEGQKFQADMITDASAAGLAPTVLKGAARLATARAGQLTRQWKTVNARRYAEQQGEDPEAAAPEDEGTFRGVANEFVDNLRENIGQGFNNTIGRLMNQSRNVLNSSARGQPGETQEEIMGRDPEEIGTGAEAPEPQPQPEPEPAQAGPAPEEDDPLDIGEEEAGQLFEEPPKITSVVGAEEGQAQKAAAEAAQQAEGVEGEVGEMAADLAPELTSAASAWSSAAGVLGDVLGPVGFGLGAWALGTGISDELKALKTQTSDPYSSVEGELAEAGRKINNLESNISADQFAEKLGAGTPSFGSLAARPTLPQVQSGVALHD